jgi:hypothetical protein
MLWDTLTSGNFLSRGFTTPARMTEVLREHDSGRRDNSLFLWMLLILQLWLVDHEARSLSPCDSLVASLP